MKPEEANLITEAILDAVIPEWILYLSLAANVSLAVIAGWALFFAIRQLGTARFSARFTKLQADAALETAKHAKVAILF